MSDAPKMVHILWGRYLDNSGQTIVAAYQDKAEAEAVMNFAEQFMPSMKICLSEVPFVPTRITMRSVEHQPFNIPADE